LFNIDEFLAAQGLRVDEASRIKLIEQVAIALILGAETLKRRARGDYTVDEVAKRFPPWKEKRDGSLNGSHTRLADLLEGWANESSPAQSTIDLWRSHPLALLAAALAMTNSASAVVSTADARVAALMYAPRSASPPALASCTRSVAEKNTTAPAGTSTAHQRRAFTYPPAKSPRRWAG
jgi:hypothetical protein